MFTIIITFLIKLYHYILSIYHKNATMDLQQKVYIIDNYDDAKILYNSQPKRNDYSYLGYTFERLLKNCIGSQSGAKWISMKKVLMKFFKKDSVESNFDMICEKTDKWISETFIMTNTNMENAFENLEFKINNVNMTDINLSNLTVDIIATIVYGELDNDDMKELLELSVLHNEMMRIMGNDVLLRHWVFHKLSNNKVKVDEFWNRWVSLNVNIFRKSNNPDTLLNKMIESGAYENTELYQSLYEIVLFNTDIMNDSFTYLIFDVCNHHYSKDYINKKFKTIKYQDLNDLYLDFIINESARVTPAISKTFTETLTQTITTSNGIIPVNAKVSIDTNKVNKDPAKWIEPNTFNPDRFFETNQQFHRFGIGSRKCLGNMFADCILKVGIIKLTQNFDFQIKNKNSSKKLRETLPNLNNSYLDNDIEFVSK